MGIHTGSAYVFRNNDGLWQQDTKLTANDAQHSDWYGVSVAISGDPGSEVAVVGAILDVHLGIMSGSAYLFENLDGVWQQTDKIVADDRAEGDQFGWPVVISGVGGDKEALIGANSESNQNGALAGSVYAFDLNCPIPCPWDFNDDGNVAVVDLLIFLTFWGPCKGCPADFDGDGTVGASDLLALLANWGPCP